MTVESCSWLCCIGVSVPSQVIGSCSVARTQALNKSAAKVVARCVDFSLEMNGKQCIFVEIASDLVGVNAVLLF